MRSEYSFTSQGLGFALFALRSEDKLSKSDHIIFEQIHEALEAFQSRQSTLNDLIDRVPSLVKSVSDDAPWKDEFVGYWWTLEQVHEEAIEIGESGRLPVERRQAVDDAVLGMQRLIDGALTRS